MGATADTAGSTMLNTSRLPAGKRCAVDTLTDFDNLTGRLDYPYFVTKVLGHDFPEIWDPRVQEHLARVGGLFKDWVLTRGTQKKFRKIMDIRPRGTCKSAGVTIPLIPYAHLWDTEIAAMIMSASQEAMASKFSGTVRQVWNGESPDSRLTDLYGRFEPTNKRNRAWSTDKMVTERREKTAHADPTLAAFSVGRGPTSGHFKLAILDDLITEELMERDHEWLEKAWGAYLRMPFVLDNDALLYLIMTRYDDADIVGRIIREEIEPEIIKKYGTLPPDFNHNRGWIKYAHLADWEVFYDEVYTDYDRKTKTGTEVYKVIWPQERIEDVRKTARGEALFWMQLMNQPSSREDAPVTAEMIERLWVDNINEGVPKSALRTIDIHCDFAFKDADAYKKQRGDWGVAHVCAKDAGKVYRLGGIRAKLSQEKFGQKLMDLVSWVANDLNSKVRYITYEQSMGHGSGDESTRLWLHQLFMANPDLPRAVAFPIRRAKQGNKSKLQRIMDMNWAWQEGYVVLVREADFNDPLVYQVLHQGYSQYDDDVDAFADAFHEGLYKKTRIGDLPDEVMNYMGTGGRWTPLPTIHGSFDQRTGHFRAERRTALNPGSKRPSLFGQILGREK